MDGGVNDRGLGLSVDWREVGMDLRRAGWMPTKIARVLNVDRGTVRQWVERNSEPKYTDGLCLLRLHARVVSKKSAKINLMIT